MKKTFQISLALVGTLLFSCNQAEDLQLPVEENMPDSKTQWVLDLAQSEAERLFPPQGRADVRVAKVSGLKAVCDNNSRGESDTLIYVVNYEDNKGFALISATGAEQPVLAVVPEGNYDPSVGTDNPGFNLFMAAARNNAKSDSLKKEITPAGYPMNIYGQYVKTEEKVITQYGPVKRINYCHKWGPGDVFGQYCPNQNAGCVAVTALSVVSYIFKDDTTRVEYTYPGADINSEYIDWGELRRHQCSSATYNDGTTIEHTCWAKDKEAIHKSIGRICRQFGYDANASYNKIPATTVVAPSRIPALLRKHLPDCTVTEFADFVAFRTMRCIDKGLIFLSGNLKYSPYTNHTWFTDGYDYSKIEVKEYVAYPPAPGLNYAWILNKTYYRERMYNFMRWGWNGEYDGWYSGTELDPERSGNPIANIRYIYVSLLSEYL